MPGKLKWAPFGPTGIKLYDLKLGIIRGIINEHTVAMGTVKNAFQLRSLSWLSHCKPEKVVEISTFEIPLSDHTEGFSIVDGDRNTGRVSLGGAGWDWGGQRTMGRLPFPCLGPARCRGVGWRDVNQITSDRIGSDRIGSDRIGSVRIGSDRIGSEQIAVDLIWSDWIGSGQVGA